MENIKEEAKKQVNKPKTFAKNQLLKSTEFKDKRDLLNALLEDGQRYTKAQAQKLIDGYLKKEVL